MTVAGDDLGSPRRRPTSRGLDSRQRILAAAIELFARQGYHATSISDIGEYTGIQRGALYYHIRSKEDLLFAVLRQHVEAVLERALEIVATDLPPAEKLVRLFHEHVALLMERQRDLTIYQRDSQALTGERLADLRDLQARVEQVWKNTVEEATAAGTLRPIDPVVVKGILGMANSLHTWFDPDGRLTATQIADRLCDFVLLGVEARA